MGYACGVSSARFARSAADGQAGWAPLASLAPPLPRLGGLMVFRMVFSFLRRPKTKNVTRCGPGGQTDRRTSILGSRAAYLTYVSHQDKPACCSATRPVRHFRCCLARARAKRGGAQATLLKISLAGRVPFPDIAVLARHSHTLRNAPRASGGRKRRLVPEGGGACA